MSVILKYAFEEFIIRKIVTRIGNKVIIFIHVTDEMMIKMEVTTF